MKPESVTYAGNIALTGSTTTLKMIQSGTTTLNGVISGPGILNQDGSGSTIISGTANTGPAVVDVTTGTLEMDGSLPAGGTVNVLTGGTLTGMGRILGNATLTGGGQISMARRAGRSSARSPSPAAPGPAGSVAAAR